MKSSPKKVAFGLFPIAGSNHAPDSDTISRKYLSRARCRLLLGAPSENRAPGYPHQKYKNRPAAAPLIPPAHPQTAPPTTILSSFVSASLDASGQAGLDIQGPCQCPGERSISPEGSVLNVGRERTYAYVFSPPSIPIGSRWRNRPMAGS